MKTLTILFTILFGIYSTVDAQTWGGATNQTGNLYRTGNVGIGTSSLSAKLTVGGSVNVGGTGNASLRVRHVNGKSYQNADVDNLYLNYNTGKNVYVGFGGKKSSLLVNGETYVNGGWLRVYGNKGVYFQNHGGGFYMVDNTWIRTYGSKNFYHNTGIMRTDGNLQVGPSGNRLLVGTNGNVGINTTSPNYRLDVNGTIRAKEVRVQTGWSDHVFLADYNLPTLKEEEKFIKEKGHLLGFESEKEMEGEVKLADVTNRQQEAIEKLMLHVIEIDKKVEQLAAENEALKDENEKLKEESEKLKEASEKSNTEIDQLKESVKTVIKE